MYCHAKQSSGAHYLSVVATTVGTAYTARLNEVSSSTPAMSREQITVSPFAWRTFTTKRTGPRVFFSSHHSPPTFSLTVCFILVLLCFCFFSCVSACGGSSPPLPSLNCAFTADCLLSLPLLRSRAGSSDRVTRHAPTAPFSPQ